MQLRPDLPVARPREYAWQRIAEFGNDDVRHQALRFPRARAIRIIVFTQLAGCDLPATCRLVADFSRTRFEHQEHLLALISARTQQKG
jgi:hypothetical protein